MFANASLLCTRSHRLCARALAFALVAMTLLWVAAPRVACAEERIDPAHACSLSVRASYDKQPLGGMEFSVRRVAEVDAQGRYVLVGAYVDADVELNDLSDAEEWDAAAANLASWVKENELPADVESVTDSAGAAAFTELACGIYLLEAAPLKTDAGTYTATTYLVALPGATDSGAWTYDVTSVCKVSLSKADDGGDGGSDSGKDSDKDSDKDSGKDSGKDTSGDSDDNQSWAQRWGLVQTGDNQLTVAGTIFVIGLGAVLVGAAVTLRRQFEGR